MINWFSNDIFNFFLYLFLGFSGLAYLVYRPHISRWGRFFLGLTSILYGTIGSANGNQILHSIKTALSVVPWSEVETSKLVYASTSIELASFVFQFAFAAVGAGLIVNAITVEKSCSKK